MSEHHRDWTPQDTKRLQRELRDEAVRLRDEFKQEWQRQMAEHMNEMRENMGRGGRGEPRARRGGRTPLTRDRIVDAAVKIMNKDGLDKVTMRRVAWDLDTGPASLYVHVRSMAELHGLLLDRVMGDLNLADEDGTWQDRAARLLDQYIAVLDANPELARSALTARPAGRNYLALVERLLALMADGGVPAGQRAWGVDLLLLWVTAAAAEHVDNEEDDHSTEWETLRVALQNPSDYPQIGEVGLDLVGGTPSERTAWTVRALLAGIAAAPRD